MDIAKCVAKLETAGVIFTPGLSATEIKAIQNTYSLIFPPDLREFLAYALPVSKGWINWRSGDENAIRERIDWPYEGMCFAIEHSNFWLSDWGNKPPSLEDCFLVARPAIEAAPKLIPIYSHRFIPDRPCLPGNPVLSVYQTDIIYYGSNLQNYFEAEFHVDSESSSASPSEPIREIEFWSKLAGAY